MSDATPRSFPAWSDGLLPELQNEIVTRHLDRFTRRALALTSQAHHKRWCTSLIEREHQHMVIEMGASAPLSYIHGHLHWINKMYQGLADPEKNLLRSSFY